MAKTTKATTVARDLDVTNLRAAKRDAKRVGVTLIVEQATGPNGYPTVAVSGDAARVAALLAMWGYGDLN